MVTDMQKQKRQQARTLMRTKYPYKVFLYDRRGQFSRSPSYETKNAAIEAGRSWLFKGGLRAVLMDYLLHKSEEITANP